MSYHTVYTTASIWHTRWHLNRNLRGLLRK